MASDADVMAALQTTWSDGESRTLQHWCYEIDAITMYVFCRPRTNRGSFTIKCWLDRREAAEARLARYRRAVSMRSTHRVCT